MEAADREALPAAGRSTARARQRGLVAIGLAMLAVAYRGLVSLGASHGDVEREVGSWLMSPNDRAPLVVLALCAWLAWRRWPRLRVLPYRAGPLWLVVPCLAFGAALHAWAIFAGADDLQALALASVLCGLLTAFWGLPGLRVMWVPVAFLLFCIPLPAPLVVAVLWKLRLWTADYSGWLLYVLGMPALVSGDQILRADQTFQVIEGCSGLRSAETLTMLVVLLVDLFQRRGWHAGVLLAMAPLVAFALNGVRVLTLILNPQSEIAAVHSVQGILILLGGLLLIYLLDGLLARLRGWAAGRGGPEREAADRSPGPSLPFSPGRGSLVALLAVAGVSLVASLAIPDWRPSPLPRPPLEEKISSALAGWDWTPIPDEPGYFRGRVRYRTDVHREYVPPGREFGLPGPPVEVFVALGDVRDRRTSPYGGLNAVPGSGWSIRRASTRRLGPDGPVVRSLLIEKGPDRRLSFQWYVGARPFAEEVLRSLLGIDRAGAGRQETPIVVRLTTRVAGLDPEALEQAEKRRLLPVYERLEPVLEELSRSPSTAPDSGS